MTLGWECPRCHKCYAPFVRECDECQLDIKVVNGMIEVLCDNCKKRTLWINNGKPYFGRFCDICIKQQPISLKPDLCAVCGYFHHVGVSCPEWTVKS